MDILDKNFVLPMSLGSNGVHLMSARVVAPSLRAWEAVSLKKLLLGYAYHKNEEKMD